MKRIFALLALIPFVALSQEDPETTPIVDIDQGIKIAWDASPSPDVIHHRVLIGTAPGEYTDTRLLGPETTATIIVSEPGDYFIAVTAINDLGLESGPSNEVAVRVRLIGTPTSPTIRLTEQFEIVAITETVTTTTIIKEVKP